MMYLARLAVLALALVAAAFAVPQGQPKHLWWVFLVRGDGPRPKEDKDLEAMQAAHIGNFKRLFGEKKLIAAGPMKDPTQFKRGIVVLTVKTKQDVMDCFKPDPYVQGKIMNVEVHPITVAFGHLETEKIDPEGIEENRIVIFSPNPKPSIGPYSHSSRSRHMQHVLKDGKKAGLSFYASVENDPNIVAIALFKGKDDAAIQEWLDADVMLKQGAWIVTTMPQWLAKGVLTGG